MDKEARKKGGRMNWAYPDRPGDTGCLGNGCSWHMPKRRGKEWKGDLLCPPSCGEERGVRVGSFGVQLACSQLSELLLMTAESVCMNVHPSICVCKAFVSIDHRLNWSISRPLTHSNSLTFDPSAGTNIIIAYKVSSSFLHTHFVWKWRYDICAKAHSWPTLSIPVCSFWLMWD